MRYYVAGASAELERCSRVMDALEQQGHEITCRWDREILAARAAGVSSDHDLSAHRAREVAMLDLRGALDANTVLFLLPGEGRTSRGMWVELGAVLLMSIERPCASPVSVIVGDVRHGYPFSALADYVFADDEAVLRWTAKFAP